MNADVITTPSVLDTLRADVQADIYAHYDVLRSLSGVYWDERLRAWLVTEHELVLRALSEPHLSSVRYTDMDSIDEAFRPLASMLSKQMFYLDPPEHTRIRSLVNRAFSPKSIALLRASIESAANKLIDEMAERSPMDIIAHVAYPLPVRVICDMLAVPTAMQPAIKEWSGQIAVVMGRAQPSADEIRLGVEGMNSMLDYLTELLEEQRREPTSTVFAGLSSSIDVTDDEILANVAALLLVGHETTTNLIGNGMLALLDNPSQLSLLRERPELIKSTIEELLRYDSSVQNLLRRTTADVELGGTRIPAGSAVLLVLGAANRDPKAFVDPHTLDIRRDGLRHVAFGHGLHACIGATLARLEAEIVIPRLLARFIGLRLVDAPLNWFPSLTFRGLKHLYVAA